MEIFAYSFNNFDYYGYVVVVKEGDWYKIILMKYVAPRFVKTEDVKGTYRERDEALKEAKKLADMFQG